VYKIAYIKLKHEQKIIYPLPENQLPRDIEAQGQSSTKHSSKKSVAEIHKEGDSHVD
jgi:hypothetical protein